jgi:hypothetical protein
MLVSDRNRRFESHDTTSLLGREIPAVSFNDTTVGRAMDVLFNAGSKKIFY